MKAEQLRAKTYDRDSNSDSGHWVNKVPPFDPIDASYEVLRDCFVIIDIFVNWFRIKMSSKGKGAED